MRTILLGAGASAEAGVCTAKQMAREIYNSLRNRDEIEEAMDIAIGGLKNHRAIVSGQPFEEIDVEDLYEVLKLLGDRQSHLLAPFVGSWSHVFTARAKPDTSWIIRDAVRELEEGIHNALPRDREKPRGRGIDSRGFAHRLTEAIELATGANTDAFVDAANAVLKTLVNHCWIDSEISVSYLAPLIESSPRDSLWIASLNYDNTIELAAKQAGIPVSIGISEESTIVSFPGNSVISLAKLHGSVNWEFDRKTGQWVIKDGPAWPPALVFGSGNKLTVDGPFLDLLFAFRTQLENSSALEVCGYSFRDPHVNHLILNWLTKDPNRKLQVFDPNLSSDGIYNAINTTIFPLRLNVDVVHRQISLAQISAAEWART